MSKVSHEHMTRLVLFVIFVCIADGKLLLLETKESSDEVRMDEGHDYVSIIGCTDARQRFFVKCGVRG